MQKMQYLISHFYYIADRYIYKRTNFDKAIYAFGAERKKSRNFY